MTRYSFLAEPSVYAFPDGLASLARMIVRRLIPGIAPGKTMDDVVIAGFDDTRLDLESSAVRVRLRSTVLRMENADDGVRVGYVRDHAVHRADACHCVFASWSAVLPHLMPELDDQQRIALARVVKPPMSYTKVALRNWTAFAELGIYEAFAPAAFFYKIELDRPVSIGAYRFPRDPAEPVAITMVHRPCPPGEFADYRDEAQAAQAALLQTSTTTVVEAVYGQLGRMLSGGGFDPERDIAAISINHWGHTYSPTLNTLTDDAEGFESQMRQARTPVRNVTIAGVDSHRFGWAQIAIDAAERAVNELPVDGMQGHF